MLDYHGKRRYCTFLKDVSGEQFERAYRMLSDSKDRLPVASTLFPSNKSHQEPAFNAFIYYEKIEEVQEQHHDPEPPKEEKKPKKLNITL